jgi:predicted transcriptional regulator YheO
MDTILRQRGEFDENERHLIDSYSPVVEALAALFGPGCEVVLHAFDNLHASVIKIANGHITGRKEGAPVTDFVLSHLSSFEEGLWSSYFTQTREGGMMKSVSITLRNRTGQPIGMLCVNFSLDTTLSSLLQTMTPTPLVTSKNENFARSVEDLVALALRRVDEGNPHLSAGAHNKTIIATLYEQGIFDIKDAVQQVANRLGISRHTVYLHIRNHKATQSSDDTVVPILKDESA